MIGLSRRVLLGVVCLGLVIVLGAPPASRAGDTKVPGEDGPLGSWWTWHISYADSEDGKTGWVKHEKPTFDPADPDNPAHRWTKAPPVGFRFRGAWQAHCTGDERAGGVHMVLTVSNQNHAGGGAIAYYWSPDWGDTWIGHPHNPILVPGTHAHGVPATGFQRTPTLVVDERYHRYILAVNAGWDIRKKARRVTTLAVAPRPKPPRLKPSRPKPSRPKPSRPKH